MGTLLEFSQPLQRVSTAQNAVIPGYTAIRVAPRRWFGSGLTGAFDSAKVDITNLSDETLVVKLKESADEVPTTARTNIGSAVVIVPGGHKSQVISPTQPFLELKGVEGSGPVRVEIDSKLSYDAVGLYTDTDTTVPQVAWSADPADSAESATQTFTSSTTWAVTHNLGFIADPTLLDSSNNDITSLATFSGVTVNGYTATFGSAKAGRAISTK